jgi:hypothetical protein
MGKPSEPGLWQDSFSEMSAGMNSDVPPIALPKNQAAFLENSTCRGNYLTQRSAYKDFTLSFADGIQTLFEDAIFQGATFYKPDYGSESFVASIGGRLFQITPAVSTASVIDITPASGGASASPQQAWLWQAERWIIRQDGESVPMFFDGNSTRYAKTGDEVVGTIGVLAIIPTVGQSVAVTLTSAGFTGTYGKTYQVKNSAGTIIGNFQPSVYSNAASTQVRLTNLTDAPGTAYASGKTVEITNNYSGVSTSGALIPSGGTGVIGLNPQFTGPIGSNLHWGLNNNYLFKVLSISGSNVTIRDLTPDGTQKSIGNNNPFQLSPSQPNSLVGTIQSGWTAPAVGGTVDVTFDTPYVGVDGQYVSVSGKLYSISAIAPTTGVVIIYLTNINAGVGSIPANATINELAELPIGKMGAYGLGRNWMSLADGTAYIASDIVGGSSGSVANQFRDSVLNVTENTYLAGGGAFRVPSSGQSICAMRFPATLDSSLGQGPLQVLTQTTTFSCNAPVERAKWQDLTNPIQTQSLVGGGALAQNSTVAVNGDLFFRSTDGIRSLKLARQDFQTAYGNTPQSVEMNRVILDDNKTLLGFSSAVVFDNRLLMTASPIQAQGGVYHSKLIALNLDPNSSLRVKAPPIYDGSWVGANILQLVVGTFSGVERCFAFTYNTDTNKIGLMEILATSSTALFDNGSTRIQFLMESPALFYQQDASKRELLRLNDGELIVSDVVGAVRFDAYYRPDYDKNWHSWRSFEIPASPDYQPRIGFGQPDLGESDPATERPYAVGYHFQVRVVVTGSCIVTGANFYAVGQPVPQFANPLPALTPLEI